MNLFDKAKILVHIARWRATWSRRDLNYVPKKLKQQNPKFVNAWEAVKMIPDDACCFSSGMAGNTRCSVFFYGIRELNELTGHPRNLTWITVGAQGSRGRVPGTLEELDKPGLVTQFIGGHVETVKTLLRLADKGQIEIHTMPQGVQSYLVENQGKGVYHVDSDTGVGTFIDPRVGTGTAILPGTTDRCYVEPHGDKLRYTMPKIDVAMFTATYADSEGNLYNKYAPMVTESYDSALAARRNGGLVLAAVSDIIEKDEQNIFLRADQVDAIIVNPYNEQTGSVPQRRYWPMFTVEHKVDFQEAVETLKFANGVLKITPVRNDVDNALARVGATMFTGLTKPGEYVNLGVGLPEEVCRYVYEGGLVQQIHLIVETGVVGGLSAPGIFFGAAINPEQIMNSSKVFHLCDDKLDLTILGLLEADSDGNVNVSRRGEGAINYVGPGGFPDLTRAANKVLFVGTWMAHAQMEISEGKLKIVKPGEHKFKQHVSEVTFNGKQMLAKGKQIFYVTNVGVFQLTQQGMTLIQLMPGVDVQRDILDSCTMKVIIPPGEIPLISNEIVTGQGFKLAWQD
ncbi:MAG: hypothetical protein P9M14_06385 [Candidatus Alcyoniella australis]|nr:hypothetical protein [Candidatus Alcyoniella australis]